MGESCLYLSITIFVLCTLNKNFFDLKKNVMKRGVIITIKDLIAFTHITTKSVDFSRNLILVCEINNVKYTVANVYLPNVKHFPFMNKVWKKVNRVC